MEATDVLKHIFFFFYIERLMELLYGTLSNFLDADPLPLTYSHILLVDVTCVNCSVTSLIGCVRHQPWYFCERDVTCFYALMKTVC